MVIYQDTRQKKNKHKNIESFFLKRCIRVVNKKLDVGDYMSDTNPNVTIDTKASLDELATNLLNPMDKKRFLREVKRAMESGIRIVILCEHGKGIRSLQDVRMWSSKYSPVTGKALMDAIYRISVAYGVRFEFCDKRQTAKRIFEILQ